MPFFPSMNDNAAPPTVYAQYPELYSSWSDMSELLMNGESPLSQGERELIAAYVAALAGCAFVYVAHSEVAYAWGIKEGLVDALLEDFDNADVRSELKTLLGFIRKLTVTPNDMSQADADAVFAAGWEEKALHGAIAICARIVFMHRLVAGYGFVPISREAAKRHAQRRIEKGYVKLYPFLAKDTC